MFHDALNSGPEQNLNALVESQFSRGMRQRLGDDRIVDLLGMLSEDFAGLDAMNAVRDAVSLHQLLTHTSGVGLAKRVAYAIS